MSNLEHFKNPEKKYRPDVRWWLAEGLHTDETLKKDIGMLDESGFGAVEFLAMEDPGADSRIYGWGSEEWVHDSQLIFEETTRRGMGVSATCGTNWSNCNLTSITPDDKAAAKELDYMEELLSPGEKRSGEIPKCELFMPGVTVQELIAVVAMRDEGESEGKKYLDHASAVVLTDQVVNETLDWTAPEGGTWHLFFFYIHGTGQTANPSVSVSYTVNYLDHYGIDAFKEYWDQEVLTPELRETVRKNGRAMMYMDSLELATFTKGGQLWAYHLLDEFKARRGYDLTPFLPLIVKKSGSMLQVDFEYHYYEKDREFSERLYNDLYQTMTDLYMENMMKPMQEWCHGHGMELRSEISYGLPFEISQPGKYVDGIETESLEFASQIEPYRGLAGAAHIYNRIFSSETGATMLNYMMGLDFYTQIIYTQFAAGVTRTVLHGYASIAGSEASTYWPGHEGMWPMFSERFGVRQPAYRHYNGWTDMVARYQMVLRQGKPRMDLGILRLDYNFNNLYMNEGNEKELYEKRLMRGHEGVYWKDMTLQDAGYTWDYFAPQLLEESFVDVGENLLLPDGPGYQALIIYQEAMPVETAEKLLDFARKGLPIVFVNGVTETIRPGGITKNHKKAASRTPFLDGRDEELDKIISEIKSLPQVRETDAQSETYTVLKELGISPRTEFTRPNENVLTLMRQMDDKVIFYCYNMKYTEKEDFSFSVSVAGKGKPYCLDCWTGEVRESGLYRTNDTSTILDITLAPGEAALYVIDTSKEELHAVKAEGCTVVKEGEMLKAKAYQSGSCRIELSDGSTRVVDVKVPEAVALSQWELEVEDWNEGEKVTLTEDRGLGIITTEVYYETKKERLSAGKVELKPWKDIAEIGPEVSGVGFYRTGFTAPEDWGANMGAVLKIGDANKNSVAVYINGEKCPAVNIDSLAVDITAQVRPGENEILVEVASTLNNRLLARGYYDMVGTLSRAVAASANNVIETETTEGESEIGMNFDITTTVHDYGMVGETKLVFYQEAFI